MPQIYILIQHVESEFLQKLRIRLTVHPSDVKHYDESKPLNMQLESW